MEKSYSFETKIARISLVESSGILIGVLFNCEYQKANESESSLLREAANQIESYLKGDRKTFDLPYQADGSAFQKKIWAILKTIPYGETWTYKDVARKAGNLNAARAVGMANHHNPLPIIVPCHRVIGSNGRLVGYAGGLAIKEALLNIERM